MSSIITAKRHVLDITKPIMMTMESFQHIKDAKLCNDDGSIFECTLINCDVISRNNTYYGLRDIVGSMNDPRVLEKIANKLFFGEREHPVSLTDEPLTLRRMMSVESDRYAWRVDNWWVDGNDIKAIIQWVDEKYQKLFVKHGSNFASSIRAYTPNFLEKVNTSTGKKYVQKLHPMQIVAYDCVQMPGLIGSRIMNPTKYAKLTANDKINIRTNKSGSIVTRSAESFAEVTYNDPIPELRNMLCSQESAAIVRDVFGISFEDCEMIVRGKNTLSVKSAEGLRYELPLSRTILSEIL